MKKLWLLFVFIAIHSGLKAQIWQEYSAFYPSVGVQLGTKGVGIEASYPFLSAFNLRVGGNFFPPVKAGLNNRVYRVRRSDVSFFADWQPLYGKASWFARKWIVTGGAGYFFQNEVDRYQGTSVQAGQLKDYTVKTSAFRPYVGLGLNGIRVSQRLNLGIHLGYYIPTSSSKIEVHEIDPIEIPDLLEKLNSYPRNATSGLNVQFGLSYVFWKDQRIR
ncbi:hypothetical protein H8S90_10940 [Olivibacter sp. SDN3]|uniref:hypothetical protein n=1 Tax=Olivibacter sp. SDN3 TaxID=2764720 RepID=UPI0016510EFA|nr:hypothetical protein [Olivibacter sp. SDN3]QNL52038.1 hypothetical protein H8S90_10940 [Olivibacter sp. SDN3]